jgi:hypothetical protein
VQVGRKSPTGLVMSAGTERSCARVALLDDVQDASHIGYGSGV